SIATKRGLAQARVSSSRLPASSRRGHRLSPDAALWLSDPLAVGARRRPARGRRAVGRRRRLPELEHGGGTDHRRVADAPESLDGGGGGGELRARMLARRGP